MSELSLPGLTTWPLFCDMENLCHHVVSYRCMLCNTGPESSYISHGVIVYQRLQDVFDMLIKLLKKKEKNPYRYIMIIKM